MKKGTPVLVDGRLTMNEWEDKTTGQKRTSIEVVAERIQNLAWNGANGGYANKREEKKPEPKPREIEEPIPESEDLPF